MIDAKLIQGKWVPVDESKFTDTSKGQITYNGPALSIDEFKVNIDGVSSTVAMFKTAPDMYKALEDLMKLNEENDVEYLCGTDLLNQIKSVLARAKGES